jgi:hypothetical protein
MNNALDKIVTRGKPHHLLITSEWGVPAYWLEKQFNKEETLEELLEKFYIWLRYGFTAGESNSLKEFSIENPNLDTSQMRWGIWTYLDSVFSKTDYRELVNEIIKKDYSNVDSDRKGIL